MPAPGRLRIDRFHVDYVVLAARASAPDMRSRLDHVVRARLPSVLVRTLAPLLDQPDERVILIRELRVELAVRSRWDSEHVAAEWSGRIARELSRAVSSAHGDATMVNADGIVAFANPAAYVAQFVMDLASDDAWKRWYYGAFHGLRVLSTSGAIRTVLSEHRERGLAALLVVPRARRRRIIDRLAPNDCRKLLDALSGAGVAAYDDAIWTALSDAWRDLPPLVPTRDAEPGVALELYLRACDEAPSTAGPLLGRYVRALVCLARLLGESDRRFGDRLVAALSGGDDASLIRAAPHTADVLRPLREAPPAWLAAFRKPLTGNAGTERAPSSGVGTSRSTTLGGIFLLGPFLTGLALDDLCAGWPAAGETSAAAALRLVILAKALGRPRTARVFWDPLARDLAGVAPSLTLETLRAWARSLSPASLGALTTKLTRDRRIERREDNAPVALLRSGGRRAVMVLLDASTGAWYRAERIDPRRLGRAAQGAVAWMQANGIAAERIIADADLVGQFLPSAGARVVTVEAALADASGERDPRVASVLERRARLDADLDHVTDALGVIPGRANLVFAVIVQRVLRDLAARLPGFHASSLPYLFASFLDVTATVDVEGEPERWVVHLSRPPLQFILSLSGRACISWSPPWRPAITVALCQDGT